MILQSILNIFSEFHAHAAEKLGAGSDCIRVEFLLVDIVFNLLIPSPCFLELFEQLYFASLAFLTFKGCSKSPGSLLVHLGSRRTSINSQVQCFSRPNNIHEDINVLIDVFALLFEVLRDSNILSSRVAAGMDQTIHVDVEIIDVGVSC